MSLIRNRNQVKQVIDFTGVQNGKLHPSDIDFVLEFDNNVLILGEVKRKYNKIPTGQKLILERIVDRWGEGGMALKVEHEYKDENTDIPLVKCFVTARYYNGVWTYYKDSIDFITYVNKIGEHFNCKKCVF
jgi:hypothetical protein|tara:strand:- start:2210 stop:2602 length:393 start_codon:yes stop_codon:yes gene_type:complete